MMWLWLALNVLFAGYCLFRVSKAQAETRRLLAQSDRIEHEAITLFHSAYINLGNLKIFRQTPAPPLYKLALIQLREGLTLCGEIPIELDPETGRPAREVPNG